MKHFGRSAPVAAILLLACATSADQSKWSASLHGAPPIEGVARVYSADLAKTLRAAENALRTYGLVQDQDCPFSANHELDSGAHVPCVGFKETQLDARTTAVFALKYSGSSDHQWWNGEQVRLILQETASNQTTVRVLSKFRTQTIVGRRGDYSSAILGEIGRQLKWPPGP